MGKITVMELCIEIKRFIKTQLSSKRKEEKQTKENRLRLYGLKHSEWLSEEQKK